MYHFLEDIILHTNYMQELLEIRKYFERPASGAGKGLTFNSPHFEILYHSTQQLAEEIND